MQEPKFYEYAIIRLVPRVERQEFINVGLILYSKDGKYLKSRTHIDPNKVSSFNSELNIDEVHRNLDAFNAICSGDKIAGPMAMEDLPSRFRWLTATRSSSIQTSKPHVGSSKNLEETFERLYQELVV